MEAVMGEAGEGNKEECNNSLGETGGTRMNGEVNGSMEEAMDVCDVPRLDPVALKKVSSDVISDKVLDETSNNSLSDNVSCSSKEFNKESDLNGEMEDNGDEVPISESAEESGDLGVEVPGDEEMDVEDVDSINDGDNEGDQQKDSDANETDKTKEIAVEESELKSSGDLGRTSESLSADKDGVLSDGVGRDEGSMDCDALNKSDASNAQDSSIEDPLLDKIESNHDSGDKPEKEQNSDVRDIGKNKESDVSNMEVDKELEKSVNDNDSLCDKTNNVTEVDSDTPEIIPDCDPLGELDDNESDPLGEKTVSNDVPSELEVVEKDPLEEEDDKKSEEGDEKSKSVEKANEESSRGPSPVGEKSDDSSKEDKKGSGDVSSSKNDEKADEKDETDTSPNDSKIGESPGKVKKPRKSATLVNLTPRRSSRNLNKQKSYVEKEEDPEIQEITPVDPLADSGPVDPLRDDKENSKARSTKKNTIVVSDTKRLVEIAAGSKGLKGGKKEPTLVIIDTNSILSGRGPVPVSQGTPSVGPSSSASSSSQGYSVLPVAVPAQGMYPPMRSSAPPPPVQAPVPPAPVVRPAPPPPPPPQILPSLTDDMYVVEAPSFIVPYVYEKPPMKPFKDYIEGLGKEVQQLKEKEEKEELARKLAAEKAAAEEREKAAEASVAGSMSEKSSAESSESGKDDSTKSETSTVDVKKEERIDEEKGDPLKETTKVPDGETKVEEKEECNDAKVSSTDDKKDGEKERKPETGDLDQKSVENQSEKKGDSENNKEGSGDSLKTGEDKAESKSSETSTPASSGEKSESKPDSEKDKDKVQKVPTYFDNPLGKFFSQIGVNLVQEYVQTELLRSQKRKREREGGKGNATTQFAINSLIKNLELSKENNEPFHLEQRKCEYCSFKTESTLVMAQHLETPHMRNYVYRCNFCPLEVRSPHDILFHMEAEHNVRGRLERAPAFHQCPNCPFEDNQKGKLTRHLMSCSKKHKPEKNQEPPPDWEPPAKIPRIARSRPTALGLGAAAYQAMAANKNAQHPLLPKLIPGATMGSPPNPMGRGRGRPPIHSRYMSDMKVPQQRPIAPTQIRQNMMYRPGGPSSQPQVLLPATYQIAGSQIYQVVGSQGQVMPMMPGNVPSVPRLTLMPPSAASASSSVPTPVALVPNIAAGNNSITIQSAANNKNPAAKLLQQPSISITPLPRQPTGMPPNPMHTKHTGQAGLPGHPGNSSNKATFVICEICDGYIKDLEQLRNHMQWIHKVKIHPKMIYNRPPLNCQKCQFRFFTDQGLERHLLGSHGLVTSSMQEAANKGKDGGRCPVCGRVYQWKLLNHVARDHNMSLKPAHLSYKCTVCTATFGMYKQFENHVYSAHSVVAKRVMDKKTPPVPRPQSSETLLKPLKINDEITIIPQPSRPRPGPASRTGAVSAMMQASLGKVWCCERCEATFDGQTGYTQYISHVRRRHLRRCSVKVCRLEDCPTCKRRHCTEDILDYIEDNKSGVDVIELSDDEVVIAGQGRNEITITKVPCAPGPKRFKHKLQQRAANKARAAANAANVQVIELEDSPVKNKNGDANAPRENGEDSLNAVKERLRRRKSLEISQVDSEGSSPQSGDDASAKKRRKNDDE
ncbi:uncharacterized protein [Anabrus simplex]